MSPKDGDVLLYTLNETSANTSAAEDYETPASVPVAAPVTTHPEAEMSKVEITMEDEVVFEFDAEPNPKLNVDGSCWNACDDQEDASQYCVGGYHPVRLGEIFNGKYEAVAKLGWGEFSTVWLARDNEICNTFVALKISKASEDHRRASDYEIDVYEVLNRTLQSCAEKGESAPIESEFVMRMYEYFEHEGPHGTHLVTVAELLGPNLLKLISSHSFRGIDMDIVKVVIRQVLLGLTFLHEHGIVHSDVKPENILLVSPSEAVVRHMMQVPGNGLTEEDVTRITDALHGKYIVDPEESLMEGLFRLYGAKISDLGSARYTDRQYPVCVLQTREYRAPEVLLGYETIGTAADMWSVACMTFELITGDFLFDPKAQEEYDKDVYHMALFRRLLGEVPSLFATGGTLSASFFAQDGEFLGPDIEPSSLRDNAMAYGIVEEQAEELQSFLAPMLTCDPEFRATAREMLSHPWLQIDEPGSS
jgi:serine/threonine-protein kinase SRPK3